MGHPTSRPWTGASVCELKRLKLAGKTDQFCAGVLGRSYDAIRKQVTALGLPKPPRVPMTRADFKIPVETKRQIKWLAAKRGISASRLIQELVAEGVEQQKWIMSTHPAPETRLEPASVSA